MSRPLAAALCLAVAGATLAAFAVPRSGCGNSYVVARGDTLNRIARRCRSSVAAIAGASGIANPDRIEVGARLVIPHRRAAAAGPGRERPRPALAAGGYRIAPTDTLYSLARWSRVSLAALIAANPGIDPRRIEIGDEVRLPAGALAPDVARRREGRPGYAPPSPRSDAQGAAPREPRPDDEDENKPDDEDEREPMGM